MLRNIKRLFDVGANKNRKYFVIFLMLFIFVVNVAGVLISLSIANSGFGNNMVVSALLFLMVSPQMLSLMIPLPGSYLLILFLISYGFVRFLGFLSKES